MQVRIKNGIASVKTDDTVDGIRPWTLSLSDDVKSLVNKNVLVMC